MGKEIIKFTNFSFRYEGSHGYSLSNISLDIYESEIVLIAGKSGAGKTTLARAITGLIPHFYRGIYEGEVTVKDMVVSKTPLYRLSEVVGLVRQNPENQILMSTVERDIAFSLEFSNIGPEEMHRRVDEILNRLGITHLRERHVDTLSGGELQKVALAAILVKKPDIIILDEPSAYLSPRSVMNLKDMTKELNREGYTLIIIDHKLEYWLDIVKRVIVLNSGRLIFDGDPPSLLKKLTEDSYGLNIPLYHRIIFDLRDKCGFNWMYPDIDVEKCAETLEGLINSDRI